MNNIILNAFWVTDRPTTRHDELLLISRQNNLYIITILNSNTYKSNIHNTNTLNTIILHV